MQIVIQNANSDTNIFFLIEGKSNLVYSNIKNVYMFSSCIKKALTEKYKIRETYFFNKIIY